MDEHTRLAMRRRHAERAVVCACGRRVFGNGRAAHFRACRDYLTRSGYPLDEGLRQAIRDELGTGSVIVAERALGKVQLERLNGSTDLRKLQWREFRDFVWSTATQAVADA